MKKIAEDVKLGHNVILNDFINLYGCTIGDGTKIGPFVEIQKNAAVGRNCKIQSHTFICEGVTIEDEVFVGHGVMFINDLYPRATTDGGGLQTEADWQVVPTVVKTEPRSAPTPPSCAASPSAKAPSSAPAAWSPKMSPPTQWSPETRRRLTQTNTDKHFFGRTDMNFNSFFEVLNSSSFDKNSHRFAKISKIHL
jgi:hypothetical protein